MTDRERRTAAARFAADWKDHGDEKQETQVFWLTLLQKVYGVDEPEKYIAFEVPVKLDHTSFIDGYISETRVLIEQKGVDIESRHMDCGASIFKPEQDVKAGGSGCGCSAVVLNGYLLKQIMSGKYNRVLFMATGALLSLDSSQQGESVPGIAHAVVLERRV